MGGLDFAVEMLRKADQIEREKQGKALTEEEMKTLKAAAFLRKIAPYLGQ